MQRTHPFGPATAASLAGLLFLILPVSALADGKVFARLKAIPVIPDQEAIIHFGPKRPIGAAPILSCGGRERRVMAAS